MPAVPNLSMTLTPTGPSSERSASKAAILAMRNASMGLMNAYATRSCWGMFRLMKAAMTPTVPTARNSSHTANPHGVALARERVHADNIKPNPPKAADGSRAKAEEQRSTFRECRSR